MTRVTIETEHLKASIENPQGGLLLNDVLEMIESALKGVGFCFDGVLDIVDDSAQKEG